jgi:hypothetical protein
MVAGSIPDKVIVFFNLSQSFKPHYIPGVDSASKRNEHQESSWGSGQPQRKVTISPTSVSQLSKKCASLKVLQTLWASTACYSDIFS